MHCNLLFCDHGLATYTRLTLQRGSVLSCGPFRIFHLCSAVHSYSGLRSPNPTLHKERWLQAAYGTVCQLCVCKLSCHCYLDLVSECRKQALYLEPKSLNSTEQVCCTGILNFPAGKGRSASQVNGGVETKAAKKAKAKAAPVAELQRTQMKNPIQVWPPYLVRLLLAQDCSWPGRTWCIICTLQCVCVRRAHSVLGLVLSTCNHSE